MTDELRQLLWPKGHNVDIWAIVDGAQDPQVYWTLSNSFLQHSCLFAGTLPQALEMAAPYLVQLDPDDRFTSFLTDNLHRNLCIFLQFDGSLRELRHHLRKFLSVRDTAGRKMLFRYYDPRVMRVYLPTCTHTELQTVFGKIKTIWTVAEDNRNMMQFEIRNKELKGTLCKTGGASTDDSAAEIVPAHGALVATKGVEKRARMPILLQGAGRGGVLKRSDNSVRIYRTLTAADEVAFVNNAYTIPATELDPDVTVYAEAIQPGEMTLRLETAAGGRASKKITTVELTLDGGAEVVSIPVAGGAAAARRRIDVLAPKPDSFRGKLSLRCSGGPAITLYTERDAEAGHPLADGYTFDAPQEKISFWLEGKAASAALADVKLQLGVEGNNAIGHMLPATVVGLSPVRVEVPVTPSKSRREPHAEVEQPAGSPVVLLAGAALDAASAVRLAVESKPAGAKLGWVAVRHEDDSEAIRSLSDNPLPGLEPTETGAALTTGAAGTFTIRAVAQEAEGWGGPESAVEIVLVHAALKRNSSSVNGRFCACARTPGTDEIRLHSGNEAAVKLEAMIALTGGGPDGKRGVDAIQAGWINNIVSDNNGARYRGGVTLRDGYKDANGAEIDFEAGPLLDAPAIAAGGDPRCMASNVVAIEDGETWVRAGAAPGTTWRMQNGGPDKPLEQLWRYLECRSYLALWSTAAPGQLGVLMQIGWSFTGDFACNTAKMVRAVVPARLVATGSTPYPDVQPASRTDLESHPPVSGRG